MRAIPAADCSVNNNADNIRAIVRYECADNTVEPITTAYVTDTECKDETGLVPIVPRNVGNLAFGQEVDVSVIQDVKDNFLLFAMNGSSLLINWDNPTLLLAENRDPSYPASYDVVSLNGTSDTVCYYSRSTDESGFILLFSPLVNFHLLILYVRCLLNVTYRCTCMVTIFFFSQKGKVYSMKVCLRQQISLIPLVETS